MNWTFSGYPSKELTPETAQQYWGFVYLIHCTKTNKSYVGKKFFTKSKIRQVKKRKKKTRVDSDWQNYWGSSEVLQADIEKYGKECFTRIVLHLCKSKAECTYYESYEIFSRQALISPAYYNDWCSCKIRRKHLKSIQISS